MPLNLCCCNTALWEPAQGRQIGKIKARTSNQALKALMLLQRATRLL